MASHQMFRGIRRRIRETVIATAIGAALGAACIVTVVGAAIGLMDRPSAHRDTSVKEHQALASIQDTASAKAPATTAAPTSPSQVVSQSSACSDKAWPPCLSATGNHASSQNEPPATATSVPYFAGSISTASYPAETGAARPGASPSAPAPVVTDQAAAPNQNKSLVGANEGGDVAPASHEQMRELAPAASDWRSRRAERRYQRRAEREQRRFERRQYRYSRRAEPPAPQAVPAQTVPAQTVEPPTEANSKAGETSAVPSATEQRTADNADRVTSSQRHKRKARSGTQQPEAVSQDPPREPDYAERRDDGFGFFFGR